MELFVFGSLSISIFLFFEKKKMFVFFFFKGTRVLALMEEKRLLLEQATILISMSHFEEDKQLIDYIVM